MKFYIEKVGFGNAVLYIVKNGSGTEQYTGPFLQRLKDTIKSRHLDAEFVEKEEPATFTQRLVG